MSLAADGDYWRLLNPGEYKVIVWAEGYFPSVRHCRVGMEPRPTICDFTLTKTPIQRLKEIRAKGGKIPQDLQLRLRALRLRKLRATTKVINRRRESQREQQEQRRRARSIGARRSQGGDGIRGWRGRRDKPDDGLIRFSSNGETWPLGLVTCSY